MNNTTPAYVKWLDQPMSPEVRERSVFGAPSPLPFQEIHEKKEHRAGPPSTSADGYSAYGSFTIPEGAQGSPLYGTCSLFLGVDDWGLFEVKNSLGQVVARVDLQEDPQDAGAQGGHQYHSTTGGAQLPSGAYSWEVNQSNIDYKPASDNVSICNYSIDVVPREAGGKKNPELCPCEGDTCNHDGGAPPAAFAQTPRNGGAGSASPAGCSVNAQSSAAFMYWSCNFASFRGLGDIPSGRIELREEDSVEGMQSPASLAFNHPLTSYLNVPEGGLAAGSRFDLVQGRRVMAMRCDGNGADVRPVGVDTQGGGLASLITANGRQCLRWNAMDGSLYLFSAETGELLTYTTPDKQTITNDSSCLDVKRAQDGSLQQIWNLWDGLLNVETVTPSGYVIALYTPGQITGTDEKGFYTVTGAPFKTFTLALCQNKTRLTITEQTPGRQDYAVAWWKNGLAWNMQKGTGLDALLTARTRTELEATVWQLVTEQSKNGEPASRICEIYQSTDLGALLLTRVDGYGSDEAQTTQYAYDQCGQLKQETAPDGSQTRYAYDLYGRLITRDQPWAENGRRITRCTYAHSAAGNFNDDIATETEELRPLEGHVKTLTNTTCKYTTANHVKRTEKRITGLGITGTRLTVTEQCLSTAPDIHARGRTRMNQAADGVQTWYDYAATSEHGALYTETKETRVNGKTVPGQSARTITWITAAGQRVREETHVLLTNGNRPLTGSADYQFDTQNRWIRRTLGNGRVTERELMCDGRTLWERDEDGITTSYGYDSARRLIETIRTAVMDGEEVITPETITSWTRDALGRVVEEQTDTGAMSTVRKTSYDLLGRTDSTTDALGRKTTYGYSADGLTVTQTLPTGATYITRSAPDGTVMEQSGTGQRHTRACIDLVNDGIRTITKAFDQETETELQRSIVNGLGETLRTGTPNTTGGAIYTRNTWNAKGQLIQTQTDAASAAATMAPTLWEYDELGNRTKETWKLDNTPTPANSRITTWAYGTEQRQDGIYRITTATKNNGKGTTYTESTAQLISSLSPLLANKTIFTDARGNTSVTWTEYGDGASRLQKSLIPTSALTAQAQVIDDYTITQTDHTGVTSSQSRAWTATGITHVNTDARGNHTTTRTDIAGRVISVTDAAGNVTTTQYGPCCDNPILITDALGNTACYRYDNRGRKTAQWGTGIQPACFTYDEADRITGVTTYRAEEGDITTDPTGRTDGDTTTWQYHDATGLELQKTWADGTHEDTTWNTLNLKSTLTDARGIVTTWTWNANKGVCTAITYSDGTPGQQLAYNQLNQLISITDASGTRNIGYNQYNEQETDTLTADGVTHLITEQRDALGRGTGYTCAKAGVAQQTVSISYDGCGRIATASFLHGEKQQRFTYGYLPGTGLLHTLAHPNGITVTHSYEQNRDLVTSIVCHRGKTALATRTQTCDALGRPTTRTQQRGTEPARTDNFTCNHRSELTAATLGNDAYAYAYAYDNIGNRKTAQEAEQATAYQTNSLNQYTQITEKEQTPFEPVFDAAGNQTLIKTSTGIWQVEYNADNRPVCFTRHDGQTIVENGYDCMGRRYIKKITQNGTLASHERYLYRGYLQIAALDMLDSQNLLQTILWDPSEPTATRPLALMQDNNLYTYGHDLNKNVAELYNDNGTIATAYDYTPFGQVTATGTADQPIQWSSEIYDPELGLDYYNYRHYNPADGRWFNRDPIRSLQTSLKAEKMEDSPVLEFPWQYTFCNNAPVKHSDVLGLWSVGPKAPKKNTVVTDGKGGLKIYLGEAPEGSVDRKCCLDCLMEHEQSHLNDILAANPRIGFDDKGKPYPAGRVFNPTYGRELIESEIKAYGVEITCLKKSLQKPEIKKSRVCTKRVGDRIKNHEAILELYNNELNKLQ